ncbi:MAG TPA: hypothetical protein VIL20_29640 [Sandaracinaceae bacterium]
MSPEESSSRRESPPRRPSSSISAQRLAAQLLDEDDRIFLENLRSAGLLGELDEDELLRIASEASEEDTDARRITLLETYYEAAGDAEASLRRRKADRFFVQRVGEPATAGGLVKRLSELAPELAGVKLERIGGEDGPLVLRVGDDVAAVLDDYEEETDTDEFDLREAEARRRAVPMVTVRGLVRALNVLLDRRGVRVRLVAMRGDAEREAYVALGVSEAVQLAQLGYLEDEDPADVMELGAW